LENRFSSVDVSEVDVYIAKDYCDAAGVPNSEIWLLFAGIDCDPIYSVAVIS